MREGHVFVIVSLAYLTSAITSRRRLLLSQRDFQMVGLQTVLQQVALIVCSDLGNLGLVLTVNHVCIVGGKAASHPNNIKIVEVVVRLLTFALILDKDAFRAFATLCLGNVEIVVQICSQLTG